MRIKSHLGLIAILALGISSCKIQEQVISDKDPNDYIKDVGEVEGPGNIENAPSLPAPATEITPPPLTPEALPIAPGQGFVSAVGGSNTGGVHYKGGSQGHERPADTGNVDAPGPKGPSGICGNNIVEVSPQSQAKCPYLIYAVENQAATTKLYVINEVNGGATFLTNLSGIKNVSALEFDADGTLYAVGVDPLDAGGDYSLFTIDCSSIANTVKEIGELTPAPSGQITDLTFDAFGTLYGLDSSNLYKINKANASTFNFAASSDSDLALFATPLDSPDIYRARVNVHKLNYVDGSVIDTDSLNLGPNLEITDADVDYFNLRNYALEHDTGAGEIFVSLIKFDGSNYSVERLNTNPAPFLEGIAVNRVYEECDGEVPDIFGPGVSCVECRIIESICNDTTDYEIPIDIDNDLDGFANCLDADCFEQPCPDDGLFCTVDERCNASFLCAGSPRDCGDNNDCTTDTCDEANDECDHLNKPENTLCDDNPNPTGSACILGTCHLIGSTIDCLDTPKELIPVASGGCDDANVCTADSCFEKPHQNPNFACEYESLNGQICPLDGLGEVLGICLPTVDTAANPDTLSSQCNVSGIVFVTNSTHNGNLGGLSGADTICNNTASAASLPGTYKAWLSTSSVNARDRVLDISYFTTGGTLVALNKTDLTDGNIQNRIRFNENGVDIGSSAIWTGTLPTGLKNTDTCTNWTSSSPSVIGTHGSTGVTTSGWTDSGTTACDIAIRLYCFQVTP